ncbi:MAG TPA: PDZ domain-containing protein, partial [Pirellulaceae bacterium]|nr:PDZ domain-containing protein [Pirellulaceae bacterium]
SFKERGRVNVGLGYAISINQAKHFIPDLLATKMVQHGTLDAIFGNRGGEVICHTINLDSPLAKAGVQLGDKLLAFEGQKITGANQFTNLVTTLPAGWPCEVTFEHEGKVSTVHVRLTPLPYGPKQAPPMPMPMPKEDKPAEEKKPADEPKDEKKPDEGKPEEKKEAEPKAPEAGDEKKPDEKPADKKDEPKKPDGTPLPIRLPGKPAPNFGTAGEVRDEKLNIENAQRIVTRWRQSVGLQAGQTAAGWTIEDQLSRGDAHVGEQTITIARDGRFRQEVTLDEKVTRFGYDGKEFWSQAADGEVTTFDAERLCRNPFAAQGYTLASMLTDAPLSSLGKVLIDAGDKANQQLAYRLKAVDADNDAFYVWLSVLNTAGEPEVRLLKTSEAYDDERTLAVIYEDWQPVGTVSLPHQRRLVSGLAETTGLKIVTQNARADASFADTFFQKPSHETAK